MRLTGAKQIKASALHITNGSAVVYHHSPRECISSMRQPCISPTALPLYIITHPASAYHQGACLAYHQRLCRCISSLAPRVHIIKAPALHIYYANAESAYRPAVSCVIRRVGRRIVNIYLTASDILPLAVM